MIGALAAALVLAVTPGQAATVRVPVANVWEAPNAGHLPLDPHAWPTATDTVSQRLALAGRMPTQVPRGVLPAAATRLLPPTRADLARTAKRVLGLRYLWGGLSAWGYDCSGLTWAVYRAHAITIPRDADAQFAAGKPVPPARMLPGDLLFYEHPVVGRAAMYVGDGRMIEAPNARSEVRIVPLRTSDFRGVRRFFA